jgi:DNA adenine methylase
MIDRKKKFTGVSYYGGQNGSGHYQILINHIPKADVYVEAFLGHSGVLNNITLDPGSIVYGFDRDARVIKHWTSLPKDRFIYGCSYNFVNCDYTAAKLILQLYQHKKVFIHFDPPYRMTSPKKYLYDIVTDADFTDFLKFVLSIAGSCPVMVSHWQDPLFDEYLCGTGGFLHIPFKTMSRRGQIDNGIYINYHPATIDLADKSFVGSNFTDRQRIKRKVERKVKNILSMPDRERQALLESLFKSLEGSAHEKLLDVFQSKPG